MIVRNESREEKKNYHRYLSSKSFQIHTERERRNKKLTQRREGVKMRLKLAQQ
jgi:hypothetical protein